LNDALDLRFKGGLYHKLSAYVQRCEAFAEFKATYVPWSAPKT